MTLIKIVEVWLIEHGFDGFIHPDGECGCCMKHGLFTCNEFDNGPHYNCEPAYLHEAPPGEVLVDDYGAEHEWLMSTKKTLSVIHRNVE